MFLLVSPARFTSAQADRTPRLQEVPILSVSSLLYPESTQAGINPVSAARNSTNPCVVKLLISEPYLLFLMQQHLLSNLLTRQKIKRVINNKTVMVIISQRVLDVKVQGFSQPNIDF